VSVDVNAAHLDVVKVEELIDDEQYAVGVVLLERVVAMLTKMIDAHGVVAVHVHGNATVIVIQPVDGSDATL